MSIQTGQTGLSCFRLLFAGRYEEGDFVKGTHCRIMVRPAAELVGAVIVLCFLAGTVSAGTINAATCSRADVGTAVASATYGDTVLVPAGTCTWASTLTITKGITLQGAGAGATTIGSGVSAGTFLVIYTPNATSVSTDAKIEIGGFTFDMANNNSGGIWINNTSATPITKVKIHDNVMRNMSSNGTSTDVTCLKIGENGDAWGVAYLNTFTDCKVVGQNYGGYDTSWNTTTFSYGSANNFYWEDNTLTGNSAFHYGGHGGRYVARFNNYVYTNGTWEVMWDVHGNQPSGVYGTMGCEIYRNTVSLARSTTILDDRGGSCMFFQNTLTGTDGDWQIREEYDDSIDPSSNPQPQHVSNTYYFLNTINGANSPMSETQDCCNAIAPNAQYWNYTTSFNGSAGVGSGLLSARPSSCTTGVGYWATDQGSWNANGADGLFYKCTSTNTWALYYTPLAHPHPLRTGGQPPPPSAPTNLHVVP